MELQFPKSKITCLKQIFSETKEHEITQEIKLSDGMPDIGNVLGSWAQVLIRGKEWESDTIGVIGGVMCWVMYMPEDAVEPKVVESWMPFQLYLPIPATQHDGQIRVIPSLKSVDARSTSARKFIARICLDLGIQACVNEAVDIHNPTELPEDIQTLVNHYYAQIPCEAGEKTFVIDEEFSVSDGHSVEKLLRYQLRPMITENKVMAGKLLFRGSAIVQGLYRCEDGIHNFQIDLPFAQYVELEQEYDPQSTAWVDPVVTSLELELGQEQRVRVKAGMTGQYTICDRKDICVVEDAYSTQRQIVAQTEALNIPTILQEQDISVHATCPWSGAGEVLDVSFMMDQPKPHRNAQTISCHLSGKYQILYYDEMGVLRCEGCNWEGEYELPADDTVAVDMQLQVAQTPSEKGVALRGRCVSYSGQGIQSVTSLNVGDYVKKDPTRPSVVLQKAGEQSLWQLAKETGSTVEQIKNVNQLEADSAPDRILLIPII